MYKLSRRNNLVPFLLLIGIGLLASAIVPAHFHDQVFEIPAFALFPAEIALVMMLSVLFFENATPSELLRLSFTMLALTMLSGTICNVSTKASQTLPDSVLLLNWVQLICMNLTGLIATIALYQTKTSSIAPAIREVPKAVETSVPPAGDVGMPSNRPEPIFDKAEREESAKDILDKLDISRINRLEKQISRKAEANAGSVSLDSLFAEESQAAKEGKGSGQAATESLLGGVESANEFKLEAPPAEPAAIEAKPIDDAHAQAAASVDDLFNDIAVGGTNEAVSDAPAAPQPAPEAASAASKLFDETALGGDLEDIFSDLAPTAAKDDFSPEKLAEIKASRETPKPEPAPQPSGGGLFDESALGGDLDNIFNDLALNAQQEVASAPAQAPTPDPAPAPTPKPVAQSKPADGGAGAKEIKEFGRLSAQATAKTDLAAPGTLKTIGQMLLDTQAVENIIKRSEGKSEDGSRTSAATAKVVSVSRGADIQAMLDKVASYPGVDGSLVIGKDGLLIGATESLGMMRDVLGVLALGIHSTTNLGTKKIDMGELRQAVLRTGQKLSVLTEIGIGVLACFSDNYQLDKLDGMLEHIAQVVNESQASGGAQLPMETLSGGLLAGPDAVQEVPPPPPAPEAAPVEVAAPVAEASIPIAEASIPIAEAKGGLLSVNDDDIGGLFDNIVADPAAHNDAIAGSGNVPAPAAAASSASEPKPLMSVDDDMMSDIFDNLMDNAASIEQAMDFTPPKKADETAQNQPAAELAKAEVKAEPKPEAPKAEPGKGKGGQQIKEFGRLSTQSSASSQGSEAGAIKAIGRQLIDVQAVENIIKAGEKREKMGAGLTTARVISAARGEGIKALLTKIDGCPGVAGSLIVGNDGLVIASTLQGGLDKELLGAMCTAMHSHSELAAQKVNLGKLRQIIFHAEDKTTILTAVAVGVLAVFVEDHDIAKIDGLLAAIDQTVRG